MATLTLGQGAASTGREIFTAATQDSAVGGRMERGSASAAGFIEHRNARHHRGGRTRSAFSEPLRSVAMGLVAWVALGYGERRRRRQAPRAALCRVATLSARYGRSARGEVGAVGPCPALGEAEKGSADTAARREGCRGSATVGSVSDLSASQTNSTVLTARGVALTAIACALILGAGAYSEQPASAAARKASAKPTSELIPTGVRVVQITRARHGRAPSLSITLTSRARCANDDHDDRPAPKRPSRHGRFRRPRHPREFSPLVTLTFRASARGAVLAQASQAVNASAGPPCQPMGLSIRGHSEPSLAGGLAFLPKLGRLIGVKLGPVS